MAPEDERAQLVSSYLVVCYAAISLPVISVGLVAQSKGSVFADTLFGGVDLLLALAALAFEVRALLRRARRAGDRRPQEAS